ncbi:MAG: hypothetical protein H7Y11_06840, partial [Armatimonadetes bacterium]|nr:hypothetical protein [Anaerolineae bacterium]
DDLKTGDQVIVSVVGNDTPTTFTSLTETAQVIEINQQPTTGGSYVALHVLDGAPVLAIELSPGTRFALLRVPGSAANDGIVSLPYAGVSNPEVASREVTGCANVDVIGVIFAADVAQPDAAPVVTRLIHTPLTRNAQVLTAPLNENVGWALRVEDEDTTASIANFVLRGGVLYLYPAC